MLAHVPSFGQNPRGSPDSLAYPVAKARMHVLGTRVPRCLGVARSASSHKAAQALGCSLTPGLRISFGWFICMARAASVPGLWTLGFLLLPGAWVWVWVVVGLGFRLRPATPGWGVGVCVCLCACSACTPPLLAGVCGVGVYTWARVPAAPRHSWLGCSVVCVLVCALRVHPATPCWGVRCGCVCFGSGFGCSPPLLAGVFGCVCACVRTTLVPRHSWLGCAAWVLCLGSGLGCAPPLLAGVSGFVFACVRAPIAPRHSWLACAVWVCVFGLGFRLRPAMPGWGLEVCVWWCGRSPCAPPLVAGVCGAGVAVWPQVSAAPRHSWLGYGVWLCVFGLGFRLHPATPGWGVGLCVFVWVLPLYATTPGWGVRRGCVCLGSGFGCACHSWLGFWGVCVLVCVLRFLPATPGWGVRCGCGCLGSGFGCFPPLLAGVLGCACVCACFPCTSPLLAGVCGVGVCVWASVSAAPRHSWPGCWGVRVGVPAPLVPRHSWLGCAAWVCVFEFGFRLRPPLLAGVLGCVCRGVGAPLVPRHSWLGCAVRVLVFGLRFRLHPATPGWGVGVCVLVCVLPLYPATPGRGVRRGCACLGPGFGCAPPLLAGVLGCACWCA